jgi:hypothetical protein
MEAAEKADPCLQLPTRACGVGGRWAGVSVDLGDYLVSTPPLCLVPQQHHHSLTPTLIMSTLQAKITLKNALAAGQKGMGFWLT